MNSYYLSLIIYYRYIGFPSNSSAFWKLSLSFITSPKSSSDLGNLNLVSSTVSSGLLYSWITYCFKAKQVVVVGASLTGEISCLENITSSRGESSIIEIRYICTEKVSSSFGVPISTFTKSPSISPSSDNLEAAPLSSPLCPFLISIRLSLFNPLNYWAI